MWVTSLFVGPSGWPSLLVAARDAAGGTSSARRRRERRLRLWAKHKWLSVAMALATVTHHSFQVGTAYDALQSQKPVISAGEMRPSSSGTPWSRSPTQFRWFLRSSWSSRRGVEQLVDFLAPLDFRVAEQVIDVPKIVCPPRAARTVLCAPQIADQLVEVLTPFCFFEQNVDIPVPQVGVSGGCQQGFLSGQGSVGVQHFDIPTSGRGGFGSLLGFPPEQGSPASFPEQIVDIPSSDGGLPGFLPQQNSTAQPSQIVHIPTGGGPHGFLPRQGSAGSAAENVELPAGGGLHGLRPGQGFSGVFWT